MQQRRIEGKTRGNDWAKRKEAKAPLAVSFEDLGLNGLRYR